MGDEVFSGFFDRGGGVRRVGGGDVVGLDFEIFSLRGVVVESGKGGG